MADDEPRLRWAGALLPALTFVIGLVLGGVLLYALDGGEDAPATEAGPAPSASPSPGETTVTLPAACQDAADNIVEAYGLLRQAVEQVRDFQANDLVETINQLEDVDDVTRPLAQECSSVRVTTSASPTPSDLETFPSISPSASPTVAGTDNGTEVPAS